VKLVPGTIGCDHTASLSRRCLGLGAAARRQPRIPSTRGAHPGRRLPQCWRPSRREEWLAAIGEDTSNVTTVCENREVPNAVRAQILTTEQWSLLVTRTPLRRPAWSPAPEGGDQQPDPRQTPATRCATERARHARACWS